MHPPLTFSDTPAATFLACVIKFWGSVWSNSAIGESIFYLFEANLHYDCILFEFMIAIWNFEGWSKFAENCQLRTFSSQQLFVDPFVLAQHQTFPFLIRERKKSVSSEVQNMKDMWICANFCAFHRNVRLCCLEYQQCASGLCQKCVGLSTLLMMVSPWVEDNLLNR